MHFLLTSLGGWWRQSTPQKYLALILVLLLAAPEFLGSGPGNPLAAQAQVISGGNQTCTNSYGATILQSCNQASSLPYTSDLTQLESDAVQMYLTNHNIPSSDASKVYLYGRDDLRNEIRGNILGILVGVIQQTTARTTHQQNLYNWLQGLVQQNEIGLYTQAIGQYNSWKNNPCNFTLDPQISAQYGINYNGLIACDPVSVTSFGEPLVPAASYFTSYGLKYSYGSPAQTYPSFPQVVTSTLTYSGVGIGASVASAVGAAAIAGGVVAGLVQSGTFFIYATSTAPVVGITVAGAAVGVFSIVLVCAVVGVIAAMELANNQQQINDLNGLSAQLANAQNNKPNLKDFLSDSTGLGSYKIAATLDGQTMPNPASTAALPGHNAGDAIFAVTPPGGSASNQESFLYTDWNSNDWSVATSGNWFDQTIHSTSPCVTNGNCAQTDAFNGTLDYLDWSGNKMVAYRYGNSFSIIKTSPASGDQVCPASQSTNLTPTSFNVSNCLSYISNTLQYQYHGAKYSLTMTTLPYFTSGTQVNFNWNGTQSSFPISASGNPLPTISVDPSGPSLPQGVTFTTSGGGSAALGWIGGEGGPVGTYPIVLDASGPNGTTQQTVYVNIYSALSLDAPANFAVNYNQSAQLIVHATGQAPLAISVSSGLLPGFSLTDYGNGTAVISGVDTIAPGFSTFDLCASGPCGLVVTGPQGTYSQSFTMSVNSVPKPVLLTTSATFIAGENNSVTVGSSGGISTDPTKFAFNTSSLPWLTVVDNGNGTATLSGTPPPNAASVNQFYLDAVPSVDSTLYEPSNDFTLYVDLLPKFTSSDTAKFTVGNNGEALITTNQTSGTVVLTGSLPQGLSLITGSGTDAIQGAPSAGAGGFYTEQVSITNASGTGTAPLYISVYEAPAFKTSGNTNFFVGQASSFTVNLSGYPLFATTTPAFAGVVYSVQGLPAGLTASNLTAQGQGSGSLVISGTPLASAVGTHIVTLTANNGVGQPVTQNLSVYVGAAVGDVNGDGVVNCTDYDIVKAAFGSEIGQPAYNPQADLNNDGVVNIVDLQIVSKQLPAGTVCH